MLKTTEKTKKSSEMEMDAEMAQMKRMPRGSFRVKPGETDVKNCKVKITMYLDADILEYFKNRALQLNAAAYQTQINNELRKVMENGLENIFDANDLLQNNKFLKALKEKLKAA